MPDVPRSGATNRSPSPSPNNTEARECGHDEIEAVEEDELGILREIADGAVVRREVLAARHPADVRPPEAADPRRMDVVLGVGVLVVMPMHRRPPERSALHGGVAEDCECELRPARRVECAVGEVAMIKTGDREHSHGVQCECDRDSRPTPTDPNDPDAADVQEDERKTAAKLETIWPLAHDCCPFGEVVRVEPLACGNEGASDQSRGACGGCRCNHGDAVRALSESSAAASRLPASGVNRPSARQSTVPSLATSSVQILSSFAIAKALLNGVLSM